MLWGNSGGDDLLLDAGGLLGKSGGLMGFPE